MYKGTFISSEYDKNENYHIFHHMLLLHDSRGCHTIWTVWCMIHSCGLSNLKRSFSFTGSLINWFYLMTAVILHEPIFFSMWNFSERYFPYNDNSQYICLRSLIKGEELCRPSCRYGYFSLHGMRYCHAWLTCNTILSIQRRGRIGGGLVKEVHLTNYVLCIMQRSLNVIRVHVYFNWFNLV